MKPTPSTYTRKEFLREGIDRAREGLASFLRAGLVTAAEIRAGQREAVALDAAAGSLAEAPRWVRPPGAIEETAFLDACTRCDDCVRACPHWVVRKAGPELGEALAGSPVIIPAENACLLCEELPCIAACETGALLLPAQGERARIGLARVDDESCYMARGQPCDYCMVHCPEKPKAIDASVAGRPALVDPTRCTGCGRCAEICPASCITIEPLPGARGGAA